MTAHELRALRALTARLLPGPPEDPDPGALEAGAAEAIAGLLDAFASERPPIHARLEGGFVPLDPIAELGWRIRLEGSRGMPEREFAGPVRGLAQQVDTGLARLDQHCREMHGVDFADARSEDQDALLDSADVELQAFLHLAMSLTLDAVYGSPHYGGNRNRSGWRPLGWPGFTQPHGFTRTEVSEPDGGVPTSHELVADLRSHLPEDAGWRSSPG